MKRITELEELAGKTITNVESMDVGEMIGLLFDDDTYMAITAHGGVELDGTIYPQFRQKLGVITEQQLELELKNRENAIKERTKKQELGELARLKDKYE